MNRKIFFTIIIISFIAELVLAHVLIGKISDVGQDTVAINECVKSVAENFGDESRYSDKLTYSVLDTDGKLVFRNADDAAGSVNEAVKNSDIILDIKKDNEEVIGKIIFKNSVTEKINGYKTVLMRAIIIIVIFQLLMIASYYIYLRKTIVRPFEKMNSFAARVAQGNLDTPLELDRQHVF